MKKLATHLINIALILAFLFGAYYVYQLSNKKKPEDLYRLQPVTMGDIEQNVTANGTINPVSLVNVGTQVSGRVKKIYADYNDQVKKGQVLLELEDELFKAQIAASLGNVHTLNLSYCINIKDVSMLSRVHTLNLTCCVISDVSALGNVYNLNLSHCRNITDVSTLGNVHNLNVEGCYNITNLSSIRNVNTLDLYGYCNINLIIKYFRNKKF